MVKAGSRRVMMARDRMEGPSQSRVSGNGTVTSPERYRTEQMAVWARSVPRSRLFRPTPNEESLMEIDSKVSKEQDILGILDRALLEQPVLYCCPHTLRPPAPRHVTIGPPNLITTYASAGNFVKTPAARTLVTSSLELHQPESSSREPAEVCSVHAPATHICSSPRAAMTPTNWHPTFR